MRNRRVVFSRMLALVLPAAFGLSCVQRDWSVCSPQDQCQTGYTCTAEWKCVLAVDGGSDAPLAVDSLSADMSAAVVDGPVSEKDGPANVATPDAALPDAAVPDATTPDAATLDVPADTAVPDAASPDTAAPDVPAASAMPDAATPDVSVAPPDASPTCPTGKRNCNGTCIDQSGCCQASDCTGACTTCTNHACVAVINQDSQTCAGTCDSTGTCISKKGQLCTAVPGGCAAGTKCSPDGICCDRACSGSCEACDLAGSLGTCTILPSGAAPHSGHTACGGTGVCAGSCGASVDGSCTYPTVACGAASCTGLSYQATGQCNAGTCAVPAAQTCLYACSTTAGCTGECTNGQKRCSGSQPQTCDASGTWQNTGNACSGCATCSAATGVCVANTGAGCGTASCTVDSQGNAEMTPAGSCSSSGTCTPGTPGQCAGGFTCASATACKATTCSTNTDCAAGYYCTGSGGTCSAKKGTGLACGAASECASNYCVDNVCCGTSCSLAAAGCMGCATATTGGPNGTCAVKNGATTHACPAVNPSTCVDFQNDVDNCGSCGNVCSSVGLPSGATRACKYGVCDATCSPGNQLCTSTGGIRSCVASGWGFETDANSDWNGDDSSQLQRSSDQHHSGVWSLEVYSSDGYMTLVFPSAYVCGDGSSTFDARGRTVSAWLFVDAASIPAGTSCFLNDSPSLAVNTNPPARTWFQITGTYPGTESPQYTFQIGCDGLPADMKYYIDDVRID